MRTFLSGPAAMTKFARTTTAVLLTGIFVLTGQVAHADASVASATARPNSWVSIPLSGMDPSATSVTVKITASGAWRPTVVKGCRTTDPAAACAEARIFVARPGLAKSFLFDIAAGGSSPQLRLFTQRASVRFQAQIVAQVSAPQSPPAAAPVIVPPVQVSPGVEAPTTVKRNASNTGVPAGTALRVHDGNITVTQPGTVIDSLDIRGSVVVKAANVTIKNSIIRGRSDSPNSTLVNNLGKHANLVIMDSELVSADPAVRLRGIEGANFAATRLNIHGVEDQLHLTGGNVRLVDSYLHDNFHLDSDPRRNGGETHDDNIQIQAGSDIVITGNTLVGAHNAVIMITQDTGDVSNVKVTGNFADGGACSINVAEKDRGPISGLEITNNVFGRSTRLLNCAIISPTTTKISAGGNVYTDGLPVSVRTG